jgi:hypothetical protein
MTAWRRLARALSGELERNGDGLCVAKRDFVTHEDYGSDRGAVTGWGRIAGHIGNVIARQLVIRSCHAI